ncbi:MAG: nucleotidyltransferase family protein [Rectinemataceae bacterium]
MFGSRAKSTARPDSDLDVCVVFPEFLKDPFELAFEVRSEIHKYLDIALDVVVCDSQGYASRGREQWTIEHSIGEEGVVV